MATDSTVNAYEAKEENKPVGKKLRGFFNNISSIRQILLWYVIISLTGALILWMPFTHTKSFNAEGAWGSLNFIDALFVSSSAFSDTGLSTVGIYDTFNFFGQLTTLILLSIGGIGWFTIKIFILQAILKKKTNYNTIADSSSELGTNNKKETVGLIYFAVYITVLASIFGGIVFALIFYFAAGTGIDGVNNIWDAIWTGYYHASASINNSGLDIFMGNDSMATLFGDGAITNDGVGAANQEIGWSILIQFLTLSLFVLGGIGFGVFYDVHRYRKDKKSGERFSFSLLTKLSVVTYIAVALLGLVFTFSSELLAILGDPANAFLSKEWVGSTDVAIQIDNAGLISDLENLLDNPKDITLADIKVAFETNITQYDAFKGTSVGYRWWALTFNTFSTRNAGFATMDLAYLQDQTKLIYMLMMFIGSGPGSTAGGLRTTTFAVIVVSLWSYSRNKPQAHAFNKGIPEDITRKAFIILSFSALLVFTDILIISTIEFASGHTRNSFVDNLFVVFSAYGTTGLSIADLGTYHWLSKLTLISLMFIGQMGISNTIGQAGGKQIKFQKQFIEERINLG